MVALMVFVCILTTVMAGQGKQKSSAAKETMDG